ncbi:hypothetical protein GCM10009587_32510 [Microbacterium maritypicum]
MTSSLVTPTPAVAVPRHGVNLETPTQVGNGRNIMTVITGGLDYTGDGIADILARQTTGAFWIYPGTATLSVPERAHRSPPDRMGPPEEGQLIGRCKPGESQGVTHARNRYRRRAVGRRRKGQGHRSSR